MTYKNLTSLALIVLLLTATGFSSFAQTKDELNELITTESKAKAKSKAKAAKPEKVKPAKAEKAVVAKEKQVKQPKEELAKEPVTAKEPKVKAAPQPKAEAQKPAKAEKTPKVKSTTSAGGVKMKELPDPKSISWCKNKKLGDRLTSMGSIYNSVKYYQEALAKKPKKTFLNQNLADANFMLRDYSAANAYYKTLVALDSVKHKNLMAVYKSALTSKYLGNYNEAKESFALFNKLAGDKDTWREQKTMASREAQGCDLAMQLLAARDLPEFKVEHLNEKINQPLTDYSPVLKDDNTLYYGSWISDSVVLDGKRERYAVYSRIYEAPKQGNEFGNAAPLQSEINNVNFHTGNPSITPDGKYMYYTQCAQNETGAMMCNIYKSTISNGTWSAGEKLDGGVNKEGTHATQPAVGRNEAGDLVLYFSSDRNPIRAMDIFYAKIKDNGNTELAKNIPSINTRGDEMTPFYDFGTNTLYFSSNGQINIGGADVYKTTLVKGEWSEPVHLGLPVNSSVDDMYYSWNEKSGQGFVVSNRPGGLGLKSETCCDDIYIVSKEQLYFAVKGTLQNSDNGFKVIDNGLVQLYDDSDGKQLKAVYATDGTYFFDLEKDKEYKLIARKKGFEDMVLSVSTAARRFSDTITLDFTMKSIPGDLDRVGETIGVVYWEFNKDNLMKGAPDTLNRVVEFLLANPQYVLEVGSHTDGKGTDEYNLALSQRRSDAVMKYFVNKKIQKFRLVSKAYGESAPVALNEDPAGVDNPTGRDLNRRTEFKLIKQLTPEEMAAALSAEMNTKPNKPKPTK